MQTALAYERAMRGGAAPMMFPRRRSGTYPEGGRPTTNDLEVPDVDLIELARTRGKANDPTMRQELARLYTLKRINRWNGVRSRAEMKRGYSSPAASIGKLAMFVAKRKLCPPPQQ